MSAPTLKIAHVVTLITPDGTYGGPARVAINQAISLIDLGHEVTLFAATNGFKEIPNTINGIPAELFRAINVIPKSGFAGLWSPALTRRLRKRLPEYDIVHVHLARDLVTLPSARVANRLNVPYVAQTHGMIDPSTNPLARPLDRWMTLPALRNSRYTFYLSHDERDELEQVAGKSLSLAPLTNGTPTQDPVVAPRRPRQVLFVGRLHSIKRPQHFVFAALELLERFPEITFSLVGPDEGEAAALRELIRRHHADNRIRLEGAVPPDRVADRMREADIFVLPSLDEAFGMAAIEAMSVGLPVVVTAQCGLAPVIAAAGAGLVVNGAPHDFATAISHLITDHDVREQCRSRALSLVSSQYSMDSVARQLEQYYCQALA